MQRPFKSFKLVFFCFKKKKTCSSMQDPLSPFLKKIGGDKKKAQNNARSTSVGGILGLVWRLHPVVAQRGQITSLPLRLSYPSRGY